MLPMWKVFLKIQGNVRMGRLIAVTLSGLVLGSPIGQPSLACRLGSTISLDTIAQGGSPSILHYVCSTGSDTGDGSYNHPWASIQHADKVVMPGDTVLVLDGTYMGDVT